MVALSVANRNDYPLSTKRVELSLRLDGIQVGRLDQDSTVDVATDTVSWLRWGSLWKPRLHRSSSRRSGPGLICSPFGVAPRLPHRSGSGRFVLRRKAHDVRAAHLTLA